MKYWKLSNIKQLWFSSNNKDRLLCVIISLSLLLLLFANGGFQSIITLFVLAVCSLISVIYALFSWKEGHNLHTSVLTISLFGAGYLFVTICKSFTVSSLSCIFSVISIVGILVLYSFCSKDTKGLFRYVVIVLGLVFAFIGILIFFFNVNINESLYAGRLMFPFQYANTSGLWFCVVAILCWATKNWKYRIAAILPMVACLLTKSAGAIGIMLAVALIYLIGWFKTEEHEQKYNVLAIVIFTAIVIVVGIFGVLNVDRFFESSQTFIERFIQMGDGISVWLTSPILGIGPDQWQFVYPYVQSAQYTAAKIHNSYLQILLDGGIFTLLIFLAFVVYSIVQLVKVKKWTYLICSCSILVHAFFDFDLSFPFMFILLLMFLDTEINWGSKALNIGLATIAFVGCCLGIFFNMKLNSSINLPKNIEKAKTIDLNTYPAYIFNDVKASTYLTIALTNSERYEDAFMLSDHTNFASSTQQYFAFHSLVRLGKIDEANSFLKKILTEQPYNVDLFDKIHEYLTNECQEQQFIDTYNNCVNNSNELLKIAPASYLNEQKAFALI